MHQEQYSALVHEMIGKTASGESPDTALRNVAVRENLTPQEIDLIACTFNKSRSHFMTERQKTAEFDVANPKTVIQEIFLDKAAAVEFPFSLPGEDYSSFDFLEGRDLQKEAGVSEEVLTVTKRQLMDRLNRYKALHKVASMEMHTRAGVVQERFLQTLRDFGTSLRFFSGNELQKMAQLVVNAKGEKGVKLLNLLRAVQPRIGIPMVEKTAHAAVFPPREPYLSVEKLLDAAADVSRHIRALGAFEKEARSVLSEYLANWAANVTAQPGEKIDKSEFSSQDPVFSRTVMDAEFGNKLKELARKQAFMQLAIYDKDLKQYSFPDLVDAFNEIVSFVPTAADNPAVMKALMLKHIEAGGLKDIYQVAQEAGLEGTLLKNRELAEADVRSEEERQARKKEVGEQRKEDRNAASRERSFRRDQAGKDRESRAKESKADRMSRAAEAGKEREFKGNESAKQRALQVATTLSNQQLTRDQMTQTGKIAADQQQVQRNLEAARQRLQRRLSREDRLDRRQQAADKLYQDRQIAMAKAMLEAEPVHTSLEAQKAFETLVP